MEKFAAELKTLKEQLQIADNFGEVMKYFFDHLAERDDFLRAGKKAKNQLVKQSLEVIGQQVFQRPVTIANLMLIQLKKQHFYHGSCFMEGSIANVIYFEDIDIGLAAVVKSFRSSHVDYVRFTCYRVDVDEKAILKAGSRTLN